MALLPRGGNGTGGAGGGDCCCGEKEININMDCGSCGGSGGGGGSAFDDAPGDGKLYGRKNGAWAEVETNPAPVSEHNGLDGLQGGDAAAREFFHLTEAEWRRLPIRPEILSPADGTEGINQVPQVVGSSYAHPYDVPMRAKHIQVSVSSFFDDLAYESEEFSGSPVFQIPLKTDETPYLAEGEWYHVRIRYQDRMGRWSEWSEESRFKTMDVFPAGVLLTPVMVLPADGGEARAVDPILAMSAPKVAAGVANFDGADWQISNNSAFETTLYEATGTANLTMHAASGVNLASALGAEFWARGRQRTDAGEYTPWAVPSRFTLRPDYEDPVFGIRKIFSKKYGVPFVFNIDQEGNIVFIPQKYWNNHPLYAFPVEDVPTIGNYTSSMAFVPPCWIKHSVYDNEDGDMVIDTWYSPTPQTGDGWRLDMAFANNPNGFLHATTLPRTYNYQGYYYYSPGYNVESNISWPVAYLTGMQNLNSGWHLWTVYERRLLLDLMAAEYATLDPTKISTGSGTNNNPKSNFKWRVFLGLFTANEYPICFEGIRQTTVSAESVDEIAVMTPAGGNWMPYNVGLAVGSNMYASDILRGYSDEMGFDVALLGIVSRTEPNAGQTTSPWGVNANLNIAKQYTQAFYSNYWQDGMFALGSYDGSSSSGRVVRMSKSID